MLEKVSSDTVYSLGLDLIFLTVFSFCFLFCTAFIFLAFATASFLIFSFSFSAASFFAVSYSILFIISKFTSLVIQNDLNTFFLLSSLLSNTGSSINSANDTIPVLKIFIYKACIILNTNFTNFTKNPKTTSSSALSSSPLPWPWRPSPSLSPP